MAEVVFSVVLQNIISLLQQEGLSLFQTRGQVEQARVVLDMLHCFQKDADAYVKGADERTRRWIAEIRDATRDLEDVVDFGQAREDLLRSSTSSHGLMKWVMKTEQLAWVRRIRTLRVGSEIESIDARLSALRSMLQSVGMRELRDGSGRGPALSLGERRQELRRSYSHVVERDIVGFDRDIEKLAMELTRQGNGGPRAVSVHGMGGLGKTTLVRKVYHHPGVRRHFDGFAWASISQHFQPRDVWEGILVKLVPPASRETVRAMRDEEVAKRLYEIQKEMRCLVVIDDLWTVDSWERLKPAFPEDGTCTKILLTTRNKLVALHVDPCGLIHEPKLLGKQESWELFKKKAYFGKNVTYSEDDQKMESLASEMLVHCVGLPLAIVVLGGLLSTRHTVEEWERFHKHVKAYIEKGTIHRQEDSEHSGVSWVLGLSYEDLPYHLKLCFLHLAYFPEDFEIKVKQISQIWMAEGILFFDQHRGSSSEEVMEDAAYECFCELEQRCMVQAGELGLNGRLKTFRLHDLMRDMCLAKAREEYSLQVVHFQNKRDESNCFSSNSLKIHKLGVYLEGTNTSNEFLSFFEKIDGCLRSFVCFNWDSNRYDNLTTPLFARFHALRVLKFENLVPSSSFKIMKLPKEIGSLVLLRLLSLKDTYVESLPSSIGNLRNLQTLDLRLKTFKSSIISDMVWKLVRLRHLYLPREYLLRNDNKLQLNTLRDLRTLVNISTKNSSLNDLLQLANLTKLKIFVTKKVAGTFAKPASNNVNRSNCLLRSLDIVNSCESANLTFLISQFPNIHKLRVYGKMETLPEHDQLSSGLIKLTLQETLLEDDPMPMLGKLPSLRILILGRSAFEGNMMVCRSGDFPRLESLMFSDLGSFKVWKVEEGTLQKLSILHIDNCCLVKSIIDGLRYITTLKELVITRMSLEFKQELHDFYSKTRVAPKIR